MSSVEKTGGEGFIIAISSSIIAVNSLVSAFGLDCALEDIPGPWKKLRLNNMAALGASLQPPLLRADPRLARIHADKDDEIDVLCTIVRSLRNISRWWYKRGMWWEVGSNSTCQWVRHVHRTVE